MGLKHILLVASAAGALAACRPDAAAPPYVPGQPITYPVDAASVLEHLGLTMLANCRSTDAAVMDACLSRMTPRVESCISGPRRFDPTAQFRAHATRYLACVMPAPVCKGIEVRNEAQMRARCDGHA